MGGEKAPSRAGAYHSLASLRPILHSWQRIDNCVSQSVHRADAAKPIVAEKAMEYAREVHTSDYKPSDERY